MRESYITLIVQGLLVFTIILVDYFTKSAVRNRDEFYRGVTVIPDILRLIYVKNEGAAFSILSGYRGGLIAVSALAIIVAMVFVFRNYRGNKIIISAISMVMAGGIGNLIDRVVYGFVTDMISFSFFPPVFNVADIAVTCGCIILIVYIFFFESKKEDSKDAKNKGSKDSLISIDKAEGNSNAT